MSDQAWLNQRTEGGLVAVPLRFVPFQTRGVTSHHPAPRKLAAEAKVSAALSHNLSAAHHGQPDISVVERNHG